MYFAWESYENVNQNDLNPLCCHHDLRTDHLYFKEQHAIYVCEGQGCEEKNFHVTYPRPEFKYLICKILGMLSTEQLLCAKSDFNVIL